MSASQPNVILSGCSSPYFTETQRIRYVPDPDEKLKFFLGSHYEHFVPSPDWEVHDGLRLRVFVWERATRPAE
ncbi:MULTISPECIES: DUF5988 family protein [Streptomyces]|uniref:DUF5988 family protein n=1 Tax=Streptomyces fimbriatus TaxID=68197 RepID=A0ABW0CYW1_STRFI|nr:DUF5988 family protein [Streptomyces sp.]